MAKQESEDDGFETLELVSTANMQSNLPKQPTQQQVSLNEDDPLEMESLVQWAEHDGHHGRSAARSWPSWLPTSIVPNILRRLIARVGGGYERLAQHDSHDGDDGEDEQLHLIDSDEEGDTGDGQPRARRSRRRPQGYWCPEDTASWPSRLLFLWLDSLMTMGVRTPLEQEDLWDVSTKDQAARVSGRFEEALEMSHGNIARAAWSVHGRKFVAVGVLKLVHDVVMLSVPFWLQQLLLALEGGASRGKTLWLAAVMASAILFESLSVNMYFHHLFRMGLHLKAALVIMLYTKMLRLSSAVKGSMGVGAIVNLQSNDAAKIWALPQYMHVLWSGPFQILVVMGMLVRIIHWVPALAGLATTALLVPASAMIGRKLSAVRKVLVGKTDARVKLCSEVATGIKAIKLYAWEKPYTDRINELRGEELQQIRRTGFINIFSNMAWQGGPLLISLVSLGTYTLMGYPLTAAIAFPALALFNQLRFPVAVFPEQISRLIQAHVALTRLQDFVKADEMHQPSLLPPSQPHQPAITLTNATCSWDPATTPPTTTTPLLHNITLTIPSGALVLVVGDVGCGKTSLLQAILGEMHVRTGAVEVHGSTAYTAQDPWIQNATLRDNVLMGASMDWDWYDAVLEACALVPDLELLPAGDLSEIGEKGINLSGGQRHRVALARACFANADVYLLDDPLSAVDAHVGRHLFDHCICGLLAGRTRVLVTHQLQYLQQADTVVVIKAGRVVDVGTYEELVGRGVELHVVGGGGGGGGGEEKASVGGERGDEMVETLEEQQQQVLEKDARDDEEEGDTQHVVKKHTQINTNAQGDSHAGTGINGPHDVDHPPTSTATKHGGAGAGAGGGDSGGGSHGNDNTQNDAIVHNDDSSHDDQMTPFMSATPVAAMHDGQTPSQTASQAVNTAVNSVNSLPTIKSARFASDVKEDSNDVKDTHEKSVSHNINPSTHNNKHSTTARAPQTRNGVGGRRRASSVGRKLSMANSMHLGGRAKIVKVEERAVGSVDRKLYASYLNSWSRAFILPGILLTACGVERLTRVLQDWWLAFWSSATSTAEASGTLDTFSSLPYLGGYVAFTVVSLGLQFIRQYTLVVGSNAASRKMHSLLLNKMMHLPMSFFDSQPLGRLLNRFTRDMEAVDVKLPGTFNSALNCAVNVVGSLLVVVVVSPGMLVMLALLFVLYGWLQRRYIAVSRETKRLDSIAFSPIFSNFGESAHGLTTIRALRTQTRFIHRTHTLMDNSARAWWPCQCVNRWLSTRLELVGLSVVFGSALFVSVIQQRSAGLAGLAITSALNLTGLMNWMVRQVSELEVDMNSVERLLEYETYDTERAAVVHHNRPSSAWPTAGAITATSLTVRYRPELDPVLKGLSFEIRGCEKIGIAGRTGCGKSTLTLALYRIIEPDAGSGLYIDGVDVCSIGLYDLRSRLALVPQDPVIFSGTIRTNLDPWHEADSDAQLWEALQRAGLDTPIRAMEGGLDAPLIEGGGNLSTGQRQLLCMARALLRKARVLVLDEATSNVDNTTDALIQTIIRSTFAHCTVLTIAHRLHTIMDCDRVMVLSAGTLAEFDTPTQLVKKQDGLFAGMVHETMQHRSKSGVHRSKSATALAGVLQSAPS